MKMFYKILMLLLLNFYASFATSIHALDGTERKTYIVYMGQVPQSGATAAVEEHHNLLYEAIGDEDIARGSKIHSYGRSFNGFAARLLPEEAKRLSEKEGVVSVFLNTKQNLHTTRSWDFLGMPVNFKQRNLRIESNLIVAVVDTGIWVDSPSFNDKGYGPPPSKWKGKCAKGVNFTGCNNKVIGATYYNLENGELVDDPTPVDTDGHGTHTSSTAAGAPVKGASLYGLARGTARGGVPSARIAVYKVCWNTGCSDMDLLAGLDDAIADGVDIISVSIGGPSRPFFKDPMAIGSFHAMKKGILTSCSAGNSGPYESTVQNVAPWIMTVAATSINRQFKTRIKLGNGIETSGVSINTYSPKKKMYPLTNGARAANLTDANSHGNISACDWGTLSMKKVMGKIVYCVGTGGQDYTIRDLHGAGTIISTTEETGIAFSLLIPGTHVNAKDGKKIDQYINSTKNAQAVIYKTKTVPMKAPFVASFSSRGPQLINHNILKPDLAAPGLNILAAYSKLASVTGQNGDKRFPLFNIISGTSMSCPHAAAAAAYVKTIHPDWSPAAIKSALMTTATPMMIKQRDAELGSGSGQINPVKAAHPGLIYDISISSYIRFLCKEGYNTTSIGLVTGYTKKFKCSDFKPAQGTDGINYPSMHIQLKTADSRVSAVFYRTVTNVGSHQSVYRASVTTPKGLSVQVIPNTLTFNKLHQKKSFKVVLKGESVKSGTQTLSALLEWSDLLNHKVKSPILVYKPLPLI